MKKFITYFLVSLACAASIQAEIISETAIYQHDGTACEGLWVYDNAVEGPLPTVIIYHQWSGPGDYEAARARMLAEQGYAVLVADIYSQGVRPQSIDERRVLTSAYRGDRDMTRQRAAAALAYLQDNPRVDPSRIAAIGYCFGGMVALELARSGADLAVAASIHGTLNTPNPNDAQNIKAKVFVQHGAIDPYVPAEELAAFRKEMADAGIDTTIIEYADAVHAFTDWNAGDDPSSGAAYNKVADQQAWSDLLGYLAQHLK